MRFHGADAPSDESLFPSILTPLTEHSGRGSGDDALKLAEMVGYNASIERDLSSDALRNDHRNQDLGGRYQVTALAFAGNND
jgi:hypothetical protein